jgi:hypothetical protein
MFAFMIQPQRQQQTPYETSQERKPVEGSKTRDRVYLLNSKAKLSGRTKKSRVKWRGSQSDRDCLIFSERRSEFKKQ